MRNNSAAARSVLMTFASDECTVFRPHSYDCLASAWTMLLTLSTAELYPTIIPPSSLPLWRKGVSFSRAARPIAIKSLGSELSMGIRKVEENMGGTQNPRIKVRPRAERRWGEGCMRGVDSPNRLGQFATGHAQFPQKRFGSKRVPNPPPYPARKRHRASAPLRETSGSGWGGPAIAIAFDLSTVAVRPTASGSF